MKYRIIRLANHEFSRRIAQDCINAAMRFDVDLEPFDALDPQQAQQLFDRLGITKYPAKLKKDRGGVLGCAASHFSLWLECRDQGQPMVILEQDAFMIRPMPEPLIFQDVLKLDSCNPFSDTYHRCVCYTGDQIVEDYDLSWGYKIKTAPYGGYFRGAWSYVIKPHAAHILITAVEQNGWVPADKQFGEHLLRLQSVRHTVFRIHPEYTSSNIQDLSLTRNT